VTPANNASVPPYYRTKYVSFATTPWAALSLSGPVQSWQPLGPMSGLPVLSFILTGQVDDECSAGPCVHTYFNLQGVVVDSPTATSELLRGNMQGEYR
jgi:hypothetical protein